MVSNTLGLKLEDLLDALKRLRKKFSKDTDYKEIRRELPKDWPI
jgi:hypothetical protein